MKAFQLYIVVAVCIAGIVLSTSSILSYQKTQNNIPQARITQTQAIEIAEDDLKNRVNSSTKILAVDWYSEGKERYVPFPEFQDKNGTLPLVYVHENGTVSQINDAIPKIGGQCNQAASAYCGFMQPFGLGYKSRLVWGLDILYGTSNADKQASFYAVDAVSGDIVDSFFLRSDAAQKTQKS